MNLVGQATHQDPHAQGHDEDEIEVQIKKCSEENQQKLKQAKNLEDLIKIQLSTVQNVPKDNNVFWRSLVNKQQDHTSRKFDKFDLNNTGHKSSEGGSRLGTLRKSKLRVNSKIYDHPISQERSTGEKNVDPVTNLKSYFTSKQYVPPRRDIRPTKKIVYRDKRTELAEMGNNPSSQYDAVNTTAPLPATK